MRSEALAISHGSWVIMNHHALQDPGLNLGTATERLHGSAFPPCAPSMKMTHGFAAATGPFSTRATAAELAQAANAHRGSIFLASTYQPAPGLVWAVDGTVLTPTTAEYLDEAAPLDADIILNDVRSSCAQAGSVGNRPYLLYADGVSTGQTEKRPIEVPFISGASRNLFRLLMSGFPAAVGLLVRWSHSHQPGLVRRWEVRRL